MCIEFLDLWGNHATLVHTATSFTVPETISGLINLPNIFQNWAYVAMLCRKAAGTAACIFSGETTMVG
jgi:hypothetical protein